jgi:hypothetical protein
MKRLTGLFILVLLFGCGEDSKNLRNRKTYDSAVDSLALVNEQDNSIRSCRESQLGTTGIPQSPGKSLCFNADHVVEIKTSDLKNLVSGNRASGYFRNSIVAFCKETGKGSLAVVQEALEDEKISLSCTNSTIFHFENSRHQDLAALSSSLNVNTCLGTMFDMTSPSCNTLASSFCNSKGFQGGYLSGTYGRTGIDIQCLNGQILNAKP